MGNCCGKPQQEFHDDRNTQREPRLVSLEDETVETPEMPSSGPPRIIPIEELQNSKKEFLKNKKTFIASILDKNKTNKAKKPKKLVEEEEEEQKMHDEQPLEEERPQVQLQVEEDEDEPSPSVVRKVETPEKSIITEKSPPSPESPIITLRQSKDSPKEKSILRDSRDIHRDSPIASKAKDSPIVSKVKDSPITSKAKDSPITSKSKDSPKPIVSTKSKESSKIKESPLVTKTKESPVVNKKTVESPKITESPVVSKKTEDTTKSVGEKRKSIDKDVQPEKKPKGETMLCSVVIATYPYYGRTERELNFSPGEEIAVVQKIDPWWRGMSLTSNEFGWFPNNFVKVSDKQVSIEVIPEVSANYTYDTRQKEESHIIKLSRKIAPGIASLRKMLQTTTTAAMWKD